MQCQILAKPLKLQTKLGMFQSKIDSSFPTSKHIYRLGSQITTQRQRKRAVQVVSWSFFKKIGLTKPSWLPDFGRPRRQKLLETFFGTLDRPTYEQVLAPNFTMVEENDPHRKFSKQGNL